MELQLAFRSVTVWREVASRDTATVKVIEHSITSISTGNRRSTARPSLLWSITVPQPDFVRLKLQVPQTRADQTKNKQCT